jgi:hypothetical protein
MKAKRSRKPHRGTSRVAYLWRRLAQGGRRNYGQGAPLSGSRLHSSRPAAVRSLRFDTFPRGRSRGQRRIKRRARQSPLALQVVQHAAGNCGRESRPGETDGPIQPRRRDPRAVCPRSGSAQAGRTRFGRARYPRDTEGKTPVVCRRNLAQTPAKWEVKQKRPRWGRGRFNEDCQAQADGFQNKR